MSSALLDPELSRLAFEERLIEYCEDRAVPLLERVRLLGIAGSRLDTFFMTRIGRLKRFISLEQSARAQRVARQLDGAAAAANRIMDRAYRLLEEDLLPALREVGVTVERWSELQPADKEFVHRTFGTQLLGGTLRPLVVEPYLPFPHVRNLRPAVIAVGRTAGSNAERVAVIELPEDLPRFVPLEDAHRLVPLEEIICGTLPGLWPEQRFERVHFFRVTRSAIMELEADADDDVLEIVEQEVARRPFQEVVRVELERTMPVALQQRLLRDLRREAEMQGSSLDERDMFRVKRLVDLAALSEIADIDLPEHKVPPQERRAPDFGPSLIDVVRERDVLVRFPFDAYEATLERFLNEAAERKDVESIKITMYRAGKDSKLVAALKRARARGVDVTAVVELKASFDERDNIELARTLEADGVRVVLSPADLKVHAKIGLVTLREAGGAVRHLSMVGTGNLNATTARSYIDLWLLSANPERGAEMLAVFGLLTRQGRAEPEFHHLMVSPYNMRPRFLELIAREVEHARAGRGAGIRATMNGLSDRTIIAALNDASQAGVRIELMVRGPCALQPGVPGVSETIRVVSVLGNLLQHARIYEFCNGGDYEYFMGSADWRPRNMDHRIEVITSVDHSHHDLLRTTLDETLSDRGAWVLQGDGSYLRQQAVASHQAEAATR